MVGNNSDRYGRHVTKITSKNSYHLCWPRLMSSAVFLWRVTQYSKLEAEVGM